MNYAFFGTSDKSLPILEALQPSLCITKIDTIVGRKQKARETEVKKWAKENGVDYLCIESFKKSKDEIIKKMKGHDIQLGVVADFSFMIPKEIINEAEYGLINIHFSLLPTLRGASPIQHAILQGLAITGVTFYLMDDGMDTGDIIQQVAYPLAENETSETLYQSLFQVAADYLPNVIREYVAGKISPQKQDESKATYCYSSSNPESTLIAKEDAKINWKEPVEKIERIVRAFYPWPIAWTTIGELENNNKIAEEIKLKEKVDKNTRVQVYKARLTKKDFNKVEILELQIAGKNKTDWKSFMNGYSV